MSHTIEVVLQTLGALSVLFTVCFIAGAGITTGIIAARAFWK